MSSSLTAKDSAIQRLVSPSHSDIHQSLTKRYNQGQWTEHVGLEHFDGDVSRINLMKPYPPPSWDRPTNKDLKDLATRRMAPLRARTPTPPPRSPTPRPPSPCTPAPVATPPPPNLPEMVFCSSNYNDSAHKCVYRTHLFLTNNTHTCPLSTHLTLLARPRSRTR